MRIGEGIWRQERKKTKEQYKPCPTFEWLIMFSNNMRIVRKFLYILIKEERKNERNTYSHFLILFLLYGSCWLQNWFACFYSLFVPWDKCFCQWLNVYYIFGFAYRWLYVWMHATRKKRKQGNNSKKQQTKKWQIICINYS